MTINEFFYKDIWTKTLQNIYDSKQITEDIFEQGFNGSEIINLSETRADILVPDFVHYVIMTKYKALVEEFLKDQLDGREITIEIVQESKLPTIQEEPNSNSFFDKSIDTNQNFANFVLGRSNSQAQVASMVVSNNLGLTYNPLFIYGNSGLGKTHLLNAIANQVRKTFPNKKIGFISGSGFIDAAFKSKNENNIDEFKESFYSLDLLLVDDIQFIAGKSWTQEIFFTIFNNLVNNKKQICITADRNPNDIKGLEERIISRFNQGLNVNIESPEYETSIKILEMEIANNISVNEKVDEDVLSFIATNFSQDVRSLKGAINRLLFYFINFNESNEDHITLKIASEAFKDQITENKSELSITKVRKEVCDYYNLTKQQICSSNRTKNIAIPRHIAMYLCRKLLDAPYKEIGEEFGKRDHSTVISACEKIESLIKSDPSYLTAIKEIEKRIK